MKNTIKSMMPNGITGLERVNSGVPMNFVGGVQQFQLRAEGRENGDVGAVAL
jgi:hypothetical protein